MTGVEEKPLGGVIPHHVAGKSVSPEIASVYGDGPLRVYYCEQPAILSPLQS